jgi:hypothetical protein
MIFFNDLACAAAPMSQLCFACPSPALLRERVRVRVLRVRQENRMGGPSAARSGSLTRRAQARRPLPSGRGFLGGRG